MLRFFFRFLVILHPPAFRKRFAEEMLSIFDQADSKRASFGLVVDAFLSLLRQWGFRPAFWNEVVAVEQTYPASAGAPTFLILENQKVREIALIQGGILSLVFFIVVSLAFLNSHGSRIQPKLPRIVPDSSWGGPAAQGSAGSAKSLNTGLLEKGPSGPSAQTRRGLSGTPRPTSSRRPPGMRIPPSSESMPPPDAPAPFVASGTASEQRGPIVPDGNLKISQLPIVAVPAAAPSYLSYEGIYLAVRPNSFRVEVRAEDGRLYLSLPGTPRSALIRCSGATFRFQDSPNCGVIFSKFDRGVFLQLDITQGDARSTAVRSPESH